MQRALDHRPHTTCIRLGTRKSDSPEDFRLRPMQLRCNRRYRPAAVAFRPCSSIEHYDYGTFPAENYILRNKQASIVYE